ncbi:Cytoplasmic 60S subunit biogenesis factor REI1-like protein [Lachnellula suecica]|uniref:Cytoplasmic 60S subunit biogenesis factor REI1-like protein n=1 Tax=Lachnellula suecica TaxID=602035 RepID=A0A8T9C0U2_9HELO|nr:Cytoplasmic 60S subunit biogenesis factor REI1-like protein [Lachnellula suecica]
MASITASRALAAPADTAATHPYTCNTCQVAFRNSELQRGHMRSDWHRYNLKRRVTSLPPISSETFTEKVLQAQASTTEAASRAAYEKTCIVCVRTYFSENAYQNHLGSAKHKAKLVAASGRLADDETSSVMSSTFSLGEPVSAVHDEEIDSEAEEEFNEVVEGIKTASLKDVPAATRRPSRPHHSAQDDQASDATASSVTAADDEVPLETALKRCLFCNYDSPSVPLNAAHMERIHGMFIPEKTYLVDLEGLIGSLYEKINEYHECLYCGKLKPTVFGLQTHMRDKGHCKVPFGTEEEQLQIGDFYDFTSTYSDVEDESDSEDALPGKKQSGGAKLGARREAKTGGDGDEIMEEGDGWETDSSESSLDSADLTAVPLDQREHQYEKLNQHPHHSHADPRPHHNKDGWHSHAHKHAHAVFYSDYELHLPSGRTAGHRSLNKYFRQNLHNHPSAAERLEQQEQLAIEAAEDSDEEMENGPITRQPRQTERGRALASRANGGTGMLGVTAEKKKEVQAAEKRSRKFEERAKRKYEWGVNKQNNSQKHFRDPLLQ